MSRFVRMIHGSQGELGQAGSNRVSARSAHRVVIATTVGVLLFLVVFGVMFHGATRTPDDRRLDARLTAMRAKMEARRKARAETVAAIADRIARSPMGRRAQEELLRDSEELGGE